MAEGQTRRNIFGEWEISLNQIHKYSVKVAKTNEIISEGIMSVSQLIGNTFPKFNANDAITILSEKNREEKYQGMSNADIQWSWIKIVRKPQNWD